MNNDGEWTQGRMNSFITSTLRSGMRRWPPKWKILKLASVGKKVNSKTGRVGEHKVCASCKKEFPTAEVQVDHMEPVVDLDKGFSTWDEFIYRLYCDTSNLQVLCKTCHLVKTKEERSASKGLPRKSKDSDAAKRVQPRVPVKRASRGSGGSSKPVSKSSKGRASSRSSTAKKGVG